MTQAEKEIKEFQTRIPLILDPGEQITKKNSKKLQKIRAQLFGIIFSQIGLRQAQKERKQFYTTIPLILDPGEKIPKKNCKKIQKIKKQLSGVSFRQNGIRQVEIGQERDKRTLNPNSATTRPEGENSKKKFKKNSKN